TMYLTNMNASECGKLKMQTEEKINMAKKPSMAAVVSGALIGALIGVVFAFVLINEAVDTRIQARLAAFEETRQASAETANLSGNSNYSSIWENLPDYETGGLLDPEELAVTRVYEKVSPAVVHVTTVQYMRFFFQIVPQEGTGTGFIVSEQGYIVTNNHVISGAQEITVRMSDGEEYSAELVGSDPISDLAVLKIDADIPPERVVEMGDSGRLRVGQRAIAIGNPFGFDSTITVGVVSALERPVRTGDTTFESMIQTDASINPGNSGGPLLDSTGHVIGINTVIYSQSGGSLGIGFAIPINLAKKIVDDLIQFGRVKRPNLGFQGLNLYPNLARALQLDTTQGILVQTVDAGSAAANAGLRGGQRQVNLRDRFRQYTFLVDGDIIIALDGVPMDNISVLNDKIKRMDIGTEVTLRVIRNGQEIDLKWILSE
ncbi:MAG TPA: trypsin-like serine protease, partial [Firmicutes bacterium]|nr:trypsin-like serine protease [Bacillota bacterium]